MKRNKLHRLSALILSLICAVCCFVIPSAAEDVDLPNWGDETPTISAPLLYDSADNWRNQSNINTLKYVVNKAYKIGLFGGGFPAAILAYRANNTTKYGFAVAVIAPSGAPGSTIEGETGSYKDSLPNFYISGSKLYFNITTPNDPNSTNMSIWCSIYKLSNNGCWYVDSVSSDISLSSSGLPTSALTMSVIALYDGSWSTNSGNYWLTLDNGTLAVTNKLTVIDNAYDYILSGGGIGGSDFDDGYEQGYDVGYDTGYNDGYDDGWDDGYPVGESVGYQNGYTTGYGEGYDDGYDLGTIEAQPVSLNIPELITSIPLSAKAIINNAFGFELFGINIAGLLSVLLIVAIIAFVVKWLMSR